MPYQGYYSRKKAEKEAEKQFGQTENEEKTSEDTKEKAADTETDAGTPEFDESLFDVNEKSEDKKTDDGDLGGQKGFRHFMDAHVKLVTFLVCLVIFLAFMGPFSVYRIVEYTHSKEQEKLDYITMEYVYGLNRLDETIEWSHFDRFKYETVTQTDENLCKDYFMEDGVYMVMVGSAISSNEPEYIKVVNLNTGHTVDLLDKEQSFDTFLEEENIKIG